MARALMGRCEGGANSASTWQTSVLSKVCSPSFSPVHFNTSHVASILTALFDLFSRISLFVGMAPVVIPETRYVEATGSAVNSGRFASNSFAHDRLSILRDIYRNMFCSDCQSKTASFLDSVQRMAMALLALRRAEMSSYTAWSNGLELPN